MLNNQPAVIIENPEEVEKETDRILALRERYRDLKLFCREICGLDMQWFHDMIADFMEAHHDCLILAARGYGKTEVAIARCVQRALYYPSEYNGYIGANGDKVKDFIKYCRQRLEMPVVEQIWGKQEGTTWHATKLNVLKNTDIGLETTVMGFSHKSGSLTGYHMHDITIDDAVDYESAKSEVEIKRIEEWVSSVVMGAKKERFKITTIGTRYRESDYYGPLIESGIPVLVLPAEYPEGTDHPLSRYPNVTLPDTHYTSLWDDRIPLDKNKADELTEKLKEQGLKGKVWSLQEIKTRQKGSAAYSAQYLMDVEPMKGPIVHKSWIGWFDPHTDNVNISPLIRVMGIDPAVEPTDPRSTEEELDLFGMTVIAFDPETAYKYIIYHYSAHLTLLKQIHLYFNVCAKLKPRWAFIEANSGQRYFIETLKLDKRYQSHTTTIYPHMTTSRSGNKTARLRVQSVSLENNECFFLADDEDIQKLVTNIINLGAGIAKKDDPADSWMIAMEGLNKLGSSGLMSGPNLDWWKKG